MPASTKPMNSGTAEQLQNGVTMPRLAARTLPVASRRPRSRAAGALRAEERAHHADAEDDQREQQQHLDAVVDEELESRGPAARPEVQDVMEQPDAERQPEVVDDRPEADPEDQAQPERQAHPEADDSVAGAGVRSTSAAGPTGLGVEQAQAGRVGIALLAVAGLLSTSVLGTRPRAPARSCDSSLLASRRTAKPVISGVAASSRCSRS